MCSQHLPHEPGWTWAPLLRSSGREASSISGQQADHLDPGHKPSILVTGWREVGLTFGCYSATQVTLMSSFLGEVKWLRELSPHVTVTFIAHTHTHEGAVGGVGESRRQPGGAVSARGSALPHSVAKQWLCQHPPWVPPCHEPARHSRALDPVRGLTSCPADSRTACGPEEGLDHTQDELAGTENIQHPR